jgi:RNA polymerase sigma-70 factor, ECF subfamily
MPEQFESALGPTKRVADPALAKGQPATRAEVEQRMLQEMSLLRRRAMQLCRNTTQADDLVQDVMLRALEKAHLWTSGTDLRAWLMTIMRNRFFSDVRLQRRRNAESLDDAARYMATKPSQEIWVEMESLRTALAGLHAENRDLLLSISIGGEAYIDAAQRCGMPLGTVRSRVHRARAHLQAAMEPATSLARGPI